MTVGGIRGGSHPTHPHPHNSVWVQAQAHNHLYDLQHLHALPTRHLGRHGLWPVCPPHSIHARSPMPVGSTLRQHPAYVASGCKFGNLVRIAIVL